MAKDEAFKPLSAGPTAEQGWGSDAFRLFSKTGKTQCEALVQTKESHCCGIFKDHLNKYPINLILGEENDFQTPPQKMFLKADRFFFSKSIHEI